MIRKKLKINERETKSMSRKEEKKKIVQYIII